MNKIKEKLRQSSISHYLLNNQILLKVKTTISFKIKYNNVDLIRKPFGPIISEFWFEMFCYLINIKKIHFFNKKDRLITIRIVFGLYQAKIGPKLAPLMLFDH